MNRMKIASVVAACTLPIAALQVAGAGTSTAAPTAVPLDCATWVSGPGQSGNVTCTTSVTSRFRAKVYCSRSGGSQFIVWGPWIHEGVSMATCSLNGTAGVAYIAYETGNKG